MNNKALREEIRQQMRTGEHFIMDEFANKKITWAEFDKMPLDEKLITSSYFKKRFKKHCRRLAIKDWLQTIIPFLHFKEIDL